MSYKGEVLAYLMEKEMEKEIELEKIWKIETDDEAEWIIERFNEELVESARYRLALENKIKILQEKLTKINMNDDQLIQRRNSYLTEYFETIPEQFKKKTKTMEKYRLPSGEIVKKHPGPDYKRDEEKLAIWLMKNDLYDYVTVETICKPKWGDFKKNTIVSGKNVVTNDGEIIEGVEVIDRPPTIEFKEG